MINSIDPASARFLADLQGIQERQSRVQRQISSGIRVDRPSDDPDRVVNILQLRSEIARALALGSNLDRATAELSTADAAVRVMVQVMEHARVLAAQNATSTAIDRAAAAGEVRQLHEKLVSLTRTQSEGRYVFSGDEDAIFLYTADPSQPAGVVRTEAGNTRLLEDINGTRFSIARTAGDILDPRDADGVTPSASNSFNALHQLAIALENDDRAGVENAANLINQSLGHLGRQVTFYGNAQNHLSAAIDLNAAAIIARKQELGQVQDTDLPEALVELNLAGVHLQAALGAQSQRPKTSLFDYLG